MGLSRAASLKARSSLQASPGYHGKKSGKSPGETTVERENSYGTNTKHEKIVEILFDFFCSSWWAILLNVWYIP